MPTSMISICGIFPENRRTYIEHRKFSQNGSKFFIKGVLGELDLTHVKLSNTTYLKVFVDNLFTQTVQPGGLVGNFGSYRGGFPLGLREDDVEEVICGRDGCDGLEPAGRHRWSRSRLFSFRL